MAPEQQVTVSGESLLALLVEQLRELGASVSNFGVEGMPTLLIGFAGKNTLLDVRDAPTRSSEEFRSAWKGPTIREVATLTKACHAMGLQFSTRRLKDPNPRNKKRKPKAAASAKPASKRRAA